MSKKYRMIGRDVYEVLEVDGKEVIVNKTLPLRREIQGFRILARHKQVGLDCGKTDCTHYGGLGCHGQDDPANQTACKLNLEYATKCLESNGKLFYKKAS